MSILTTYTSEALKLLHTEVTQVLNDFISPVHVRMPSTIKENIRIFKKQCDDRGVTYKIFAAHKASKSSSLLRECLNQGIGVDVASLKELEHALSLGFASHSIECTGVKTNDFLSKALEHNCLIQVDSISEIQRIKTLRESLHIDVPTRIGVRIADIPIEGRQMKPLESRFGVPYDSLTDLFRIFKNMTKEFEFVGPHIHSGRLRNDDRLAQIPGVVNVFKMACDYGLSPTMINIGGGFRAQTLSDPRSWEEYLDSLCERMKRGEDLETWGGETFGLRKTLQGTIEGRGAAESLGKPIPAEVYLKNILDCKLTSESTFADFIKDNDVTLVLEPGYAIFDQCGSTFFKVIETKKGWNNALFTVVEGTNYSLASHIRDYISDPILISQGTSISKAVDVFICGSMCREEDVLVKRKISFDAIPQPGDYVCFPNTAAYRSDFEDVSPHMSSSGSFIQALLDEETQRLHFLRDTVHDHSQLSSDSSKNKGMLYAV